MATDPADWATELANKTITKQLSDALDTIFASLAHYENDKHLPNAEILVKLSEFFNLSVDYLLKNIDEELYAIQDKELLKQIAQADI